MYGIAIKLWSSEFNLEAKGYNTLDSVVYLFEDRSREDLRYLANTVKHLVGNDSLDNIFEKFFPNSVEGYVKGEAAADSSEPFVKLEQDYESDYEEDIKTVDLKETDIFGRSDSENDKSDDEDFKPEQNKEHVKAASRKRDFLIETCGKCGKQFSYRSRFIIHLENCNPNQIPTLPPKVKKRPAKSEEDKRKGEESVLKRKETLAKIPIETCENCGREFHLRSPLLIHLQVCNPDQISHLPERPMSYKTKKKVNAILGRKAEENLLSCVYCSRQFVKKLSLEKHEELHRTDPDSKALREGNIDESLWAKSKRNKDRSPMPKGDYQCDRCSSYFSIYSALERHMEAHSLADTLGKQDSSQGEGDGLNIREYKEGEPLRCMKCDLAYTTMALYCLHLKKVHGKSFNCEECGKKFLLPNTLKKHRLNYHTTFPKTCDDCGKFCATKEEFKSHMIEAHGGGKSEPSGVTCEVCGKMVKNKYILKSHMRIVHEGMKQEFPCDKCGKVLKSKASLEYHAKVHTGEYPFTCDECGHGFMRFDKMLDCKNNHAGVYKFHCTHCEYKTNKQKSFRNHCTIHTGEKPFICPLCNHFSSTASNLASHIRKVHKLTLCQAEMVGKKNRHGQPMTEEEVETNRLKIQDAEKRLESTRMRPDHALVQRGGVKPGRGRTGTALTKQETTPTPPPLHPAKASFFPYLAYD